MREGALGDDVSGTQGLIHRVTLCRKFTAGWIFRQIHRDAKRANSPQPRGCKFPAGCISQQFHHRCILRYRQFTPNVSRDAAFIYLNLCIIE